MEISLVGKCEKLVVDFCSEDKGRTVLSFAKKGYGPYPIRILMSLEMDKSIVKKFIDVLENRSCPRLAELNNGKIETRNHYRYIDVLDSGDNKCSRIGVGNSGESIEIRMQFNNDKTKVGYIKISKIETNILIGILYLWLSNNFLSSRTLQLLLNDNSLHSDMLEINNIQLPIDCTPSFASC